MHGGCFCTIIAVEITCAVVCTCCILMGHSLVIPERATSILAWGAVELASYLRAQGFVDCARIFEENKVDGNFVFTLGSANLSSMGFTDPTEILRIISHIERARAAVAADAASEAAVAARAAVAAVAEAEVLVKREVDAHSAASIRARHWRRQADEVDAIASAEAEAAAQIPCKRCKSHILGVRCGHR